MDELKTILINRNKTISVAESLTGGNLQSLLSSVNGSSLFFNGGITAYNIDIKNKFFNINYEEAKKCDCVSEEIALAMAEGVAELFDSDYSISTTGFAVQNLNVLIPYAYVCFYDRNRKEHKTIKISNDDLVDRISFQKSLSQQSINYFLTVFIRYLK